MRPEVPHRTSRPVSLWGEKGEGGGEDAGSREGGRLGDEGGHVTNSM